MYYYFFAHWYFIPRGSEISKVEICVWNGYDGDSETVNELVRHTALKRWIATEIRWYRNMPSRGSAVRLLLLLLIGRLTYLCTSSFLKVLTGLIVTGTRCLFITWTTVLVFIVIWSLTFRKVHSGYPWDRKAFSTCASSSWRPKKPTEKWPRKPAPYCTAICERHIGKMAGVMKRHRVLS